MKKFFLSAVVIAAFVVYAATSRKNATLPSLPAVSVSSSPSTIAQSADTPSGAGTPPNNPNLANSSQSTSAPTNSGAFKNGTYTGDAVDALYGNVQVQAIVKSGRIADVQFLSYPTDRSHSQSINNQAAPLLKSEAIKSQSANVNIISGATATSEAFIQSLQSALSQAS